MNNKLISNIKIKEKEIKKNKYYEYIDFLKLINKDFLIILKKKLFKYTEKKFKIQVLSSTVECNENNFNKKKVNSLHFIIIKFIPIQSHIILRLSYNLINVIEEHLFGKTKYSSYYEKNKCFTVSRSYIKNQLIKIIINSYNNIFNNLLFINEKYDIYKHDVNFKNITNISNFYYLNTEFKCIDKSLKNIFSISIPIPVLSYLKKKYYNDFKLQSNKLISLDKELYLLKNIYNSNLKITAKLNKFSVLSSIIIKMKVGDILNIKKPKNSTVYTNNGIPILIGKYKINGKKNALYIKKNIINTCFI